MKGKTVGGDDPPSERNQSGEQPIVSHLNLTCKPLIRSNLIRSGSLLISSVLIIFIGIVYIQISFDKSDSLSSNGRSSLPTKTTTTTTSSSSSSSGKHKPASNKPPSDPSPSTFPGFSSSLSSSSSSSSSFNSNKKTFLDNLKTQSLDDFIPLDSNSNKVTVGDIDTFNNIHLWPRLDSISQMGYFRYVKLNLNRPCTLWSDDTRCALRDCTIKFCEASALPPELIEDEHHSKENQNCTATQKLSEVDRTVSFEHIETMNSLFECYEHDQEDGQYIDLSLNPERYTGYKGESAHRIWRSIYEENCFLKAQQKSPFSVDNMCYEERVFYRAISGLHSSINIHLSSAFLFMDGTFTYNKQEFVKRFEGRDEFIRNLYFLYLLELRALHKIENYLLTKVNWLSSGDQSATREAIKSLLKIVKSFKWHFNESIMFSQEPAVAQEFARHFHNITTNIMDCVGCDKCKLWGKVQIHGLGTAFKILINEDVDKIHLHRHEIITLINALTRHSTSINNLETFNKLLKS
ncbi:ERO1-like protein alpha isoform X2 [Panonychus citri]|uniref:ERO1-like protein alpha isoform X2 n=1 Tax=Panonychus citri TaxID=50023 RepID=UPI0023075792|nr:ERO1-like protein alpha isoform X2 [Panonychus citri]